MYHFPNFPKEVGEGFKGPKLLRKAGNMHPLINTTNSNRVRIKVWDSRSKNKVETFNKPRAIKPYIVFI